jgi:hypothetical protein
MTKDEVTKLVMDMADIFRHMDYNSCPDKEYVILYGTRERKIIPEEHSKQDIIELCRLCDAEMYHSVIYHKLKNKGYPHTQTKHENIEKPKVAKKYPIALLSEEEVERREQMHEDYCAENKLPNFARHTCYHCKKEVFNDYEVREGVISYGRKGDEFVTGCPHCDYTFCD